jgi:hypothetical protein
MILKMQPNALLTWQNSIIVKSECYKLERARKKKDSTKSVAEFSIGT